MPAFISGPWQSTHWPYQSFAAVLKGFEGIFSYFFFCYVLLSMPGLGCDMFWKKNKLKLCLLILRIKAPYSQISTYETHLRSHRSPLQVSPPSRSFYCKYAASFQSHSPAMCSNIPSPVKTKSTWLDNQRNTSGFTELQKKTKFTYLTKFNHEV